MTATLIAERFRTYAGAEQIATPFACEGLAWWLRRRRPGRVVEIGAGIGTLTAVIRAETDATLVAIEPDAWCRAELLAHTGVLADCDYRGTPCDVLVIDGGDQRDDYYANLSRRAVVFFEGRRRSQRAVLRAMWAGCAFIEAEWKPAGRSKGYAVVLFEPTLLERAWFAGVRLREAWRDLAARLAGLPVGKRRAR